MAPPRPSAQPDGLSARPAGLSARPAGLSARPAGLSAQPAGLSARPAAPRAWRALALAPALGAALALGAACGTDPEEPPPPAELSLSALPSPGWCCPGEASSTEPGGPACRVVATPFVSFRRVEGEGGQSAFEPVEQRLVSLTAAAVDGRTGTPVSIAPPGRCAGISGLCGHFVVTVDPDATPPSAEQIFGFERFEFALNTNQSATINVRVQLRDDDEQFLRDPAGEPLQIELPLDVVVLAAETPDVACPPLGQPPQATGAGG